MSEHTDVNTDSKQRGARKADMPQFRSVKMDSLSLKLITDYFPFNRLSESRALEVVNHVRFIEMYKGEIFQVRTSETHNCLYLLRGSIEIIGNGSIKSLIGPADTQSRPLNLTLAPERTTLVSNDYSIVCLADRELLDDIVSWDDTFNTIGESMPGISDRIGLIRNSLMFRRLPYYCLEAAFSRMRQKRVKKGENVISIGEHGDAYYIITEGKAEVFQTAGKDTSERKVVELGVGDAFGEEALISGKTRNERVCMTEDGSLLILGKDDFHELVRKPLVTSVGPQVARSMLDNGYTLLDVRYPEEYHEEHLPGTAWIPLIDLRSRINELDPQSRYVVYCRSGKRSKVAAMIMRQNNFEEVIDLEGGIMAWPYEKNRPAAS